MSASMRQLLVWAVLVALLAATMLASMVLHGAASLVTGLAIAGAKAGLILAFFMELRSEGGLMRIAALGAGAWLVILLALLTLDYVSRPLV
jgi:cytochrome c oxidase subunit 4